jgi:hypothetical protein
MAFEDALIGNGDDFDPRTATESLIRQTSPDPLPVTLDPRMLNTRLARKLAEPTVHEPIDVNFDQPKADQPISAIRRCHPKPRTRAWTFRRRPSPRR